MIKENLKLKGDVTLTLTDKNGKLKDKKEIKNLVVNAGLSFITSRMLNTSKAVMSHMALGSGSTAANASDTSLGSQVGSREALDSASETSTGVITFASTFEPGDATGALTEAGIFNASSGSDMLCRTVFSTVNKASTDTLAITWSITVAV